ncbi:MAG: alpha/beta hydrolase [Pseudomonadales bacterium]
MEETWIEGPQGRLEARWRESSERSSKTLLLCHPHPQFGGTMNDRVLTMCDGVALKLGFSTLRFNFSGVGASEGNIGGIDAAADDVRQVVVGMLDRNEDEGWLMGYSFGAAAVLAALGSGALTQKLRGIVLVAPALALLPSLPALPQGLRVFVVSGSADQFVSPDSLVGYFGESSVLLIEGADHFFSGYDEALTESLLKGLRGT